MDVHWRLKPFSDVPARVSRERLWSGSRVVEHEGSPVRLPAPEDRYIQSAIHSTAHHPFDSAILFSTAADLAHVLESNREFDWERLDGSVTAERLQGHVMAATMLAERMTGDEHFSTGLDVLRDRNPGIDKVLDPFIDSLWRVLMKPWVFDAMLEGQVLAKSSLGASARFLYYHLRRKVMKAAGLREAPLEVRPVIEGISLAPHYRRYRRKMLDRDYLNFMVELARFYRGLGFTTLE